MAPKMGGPRKMPTLKKAAETPAAAPAARRPPVSLPGPLHLEHHLRLQDLWLP